MRSNHTIGCQTVEHGTTFHNEGQLLLNGDGLNGEPQDQFWVAGVPFPSAVSRTDRGVVGRRRLVFRPAEQRSRALVRSDARWRFICGPAGRLLDEGVLLAISAAKYLRQSTAASRYRRPVGIVIGRRHWSNFVPAGFPVISSAREASVGGMRAFVRFRYRNQDGSPLNRSPGPALPCLILLHTIRS